MRYIAKIIGFGLLITFSLVAGGECLRPASTSISTGVEKLAELDKAVVEGESGKLVKYLKQSEMPARIEMVKSLIAKSDNLETVELALELVLMRFVYEPEGLFSELDYYERLELISKCLSLALSRPDSRDISGFLKRQRRSYVVQPSGNIVSSFIDYILPEAKKLISSYLTVYDVRKPTRVATVLALYKEQKNILPLSADNPTGQDFFRKKISQLENLYGINPSISWQLILVQDGEDARWWKADKRSISIARSIAEEEYPELIESGQIVFLELSQEKTQRLGSAKGGAIIRGMRYALDNGADYIISTDADLSAPLDGEGWLLKDAIFGGKDLVMGSIYRPDSLSPKRTLIRWLRSKVFIRLVKLILPELRRISDYQRSFKCYSRDALSWVLPLDKEGDFYRRFVYDRTFETNLLALVEKFGFSMSEAGIIWVDFPVGTTVAPKEILSMFWGLLKQRAFLWLSGEYYKQKILEYRLHKHVLSKPLPEDTIPKWGVSKAGGFTLGLSGKVTARHTQYIGELKAIESLIIRGADRLVEIRRKSPGVITAEDSGEGPVTEYDKEIQDFYIKRLHELFPEWKFIAEEGVSEDLLENGEAEYVCMIDPIDGTSEFARVSDNSGREFKPMFKHIEYGTGIILCKRLPDGRLKPLIVVAILPEMDMDESGFSIIEAVDDIEGAFLNGRKILERETLLSELKDRDAVVEPRAGQKIVAGRIAEEFRRAFLDVSSLCHFSLLAAGRDITGCMLAKPCVWDSAIGGFIAYKAGARVAYLSDGTDFFPIDPKRLNEKFRSDNVFAADEEIVSHILQVLREKRPEPAVEPLPPGSFIAKPQKILILITQAA